MDVVIFVCLWFDHYLHKYNGCGPMDARWLGGIATYTTSRDWCTEMVFCASDCCWMFSLDTSSFGVCFLVIYDFIRMLGYHVYMILVYLMHSYIMMLSIWLDDVNLFIGLSNVLLLACWIPLFLCCSTF